ncbi:MAG: c-type cytochrome [Gemmatimonadota bacterium]
MKHIVKSMTLTLAAVVVLLPANAMAQVSGVQTWSQRCGSCHQQQPANRYTAERWESVVSHMELIAHLTSEQTAAVLEFLKSGAQEVAAQEAKESGSLTVASLDGLFLPQSPTGEEVYEQNCVPCHGKSGKGDGPAAVAFDPPPSDFTDPEGTKSLEEMLEIIKEGRAGMPAYGATLSPEELEAVAEYILNL